MPEALMYPHTSREAGFNTNTLDGPFCLTEYRWVLEVAAVFG